MTKPSPFRYFKTSPKIIRLAVMLYVRFPLSLRNVEDLQHERGVEVGHETVRYWWNRAVKPRVGRQSHLKRVQTSAIVEVNKINALNGRERWNPVPSAPPFSLWPLRSPLTF